EIAAATICNEMQRRSAPLIHVIQKSGRRRAARRQLVSRSPNVSCSELTDHQWPEVVGELHEVDRLLGRRVGVEVAAPRAFIECGAPAHRAAQSKVGLDEISKRKTLGNGKRVDRRHSEHSGVPADCRRAPPPRPGAAVNDPQDRRLGGGRGAPVVDSGARRGKLARAAIELALSFHGALAAI
ncbi:MAG: hypothetical protein ACYDAE_17645, partial [Steroidobacteraceae bacterium]